MPVILNAQDIEFMTGTEKIVIDESLVFKYISEAKRRARYERAALKRSEYNKRYTDRVAERIENDPEFYEHWKAKRAENAARRKLKAQQQKQKKETKEEREDREDREARGDE